MSIVFAIILMLFGLLAIANAIWMFIPAFVQGHAVNNNALRVVEGLFGVVFIAVGVVLLVLHH